MNLPLNMKSDQELAPLKLLYSEPDTAEMLTRRLSGYFRHVPVDQPLVVLCIGTDRSTGDSLGPLVGSLLSKKLSAVLHLYGTLDNPVHAMNLVETIHHIQEKFQTPYILAIDACLGQSSSVGYIQLGEGPVRPGAGVNKELPPVGNIHMTGIVNVGGFMEYFVLQNTRLSVVMNMAEVISSAIRSALLRSRHAVYPSRSND